MSTTHVKGLSELQKLLDTLPAKLEANVMRGALRAGAKPILEEAKRNVPVESGTLRDGLKIGTKSRNGTVSASVKVSGRHAFIAPWIEFGTRAHVITGRDGGSLFFGGGTFVKSVQHPGARARPFLRPALDSQSNAAVVAVGEYIKKRLSSKHGLDTSEILIEGDE